MKTGKIIAFSGAHGTGKTTAVYTTASQLKKSNTGDVGVILETARRCPWPILSFNEETSREAQMWIFAEQIRRELEMVKQYDIVVSDRTIVDCIAYSSAAGFHDIAYGQVALAKSHVYLYDRVTFMHVADNDYCTNDGFRHQDLEIRYEVERRILELYDELGVKLERVFYG